jgi:hypothetical protein
MIADLIAELCDGAAEFADERQPLPDDSSLDMTAGGIGVIEGSARGSCG